MNEETLDFLRQCKAAGYERVTIGVADKRVPISVRLEKTGECKLSRMPSGGAYWDGGLQMSRPKVVCADPPQRQSGFPAIWKICEESPLTAACNHRGAGCGESHEINRNHPLELGYYDLVTMPELQPDAQP